MLTNNIKQLLGITLKNFFDLDIAVFINLFLAVFTILAVIKLFIIDTLKLAANGWNALKQDARNIKESLLNAREQWETSDIKETLVNTYRSAKQASN